jgi:hypothetical protein
LFPSFDLLHTLVRKLFNPQSLISHLTNSNGCGNLWTKVLLTVSPFRPFLPPQPRVCSRNRRLRPLYAPRSVNISLILSMLRILPVATGVWGAYFQLSTLCLCASVANPVPKSCRVIFLRTLCLSLRSFSHSLPLFSIACRLFLQNTGGGGGSGCSRHSDPQVHLPHPDPTFRLSAGVGEDSQVPEALLPIFPLPRCSLLAQRFARRSLPTYNCQLSASLRQPGGPVRGAGLKEPPAGDSASAAVLALARNGRFASTDAGASFLQRRTPSHPQGFWLASR